ncbi:hypothetical protein [Tenacibaculum jejuense]|uniref:Uncharacterized protein n=1 Tax=Tenacibaculum jejuense TaxID=584609 RepID=A0A238UGS9_9FLAO|nr:hypothetical protein [Tenacibaculum jejuense]SNR17728.1 conserved protein of unknown function [Tenacibaculum jejuense]
MDNKNVLIIPLWLLYNVKSIDNVNFDTILVENMKEYNIVDRQYLYSVINSIDKNYDFSSVLENIPNSKEISFSNDEIYIYLMKFKSFMENEEYELLKN